MDNVITINQRVEIIAIFHKSGNMAQVCSPAKMKFGDKEILLTELGLRHPTAKGKRMIHVFDMSDGTTDYRIEFDAEALSWTLVAIMGGHY